MIRRFAPLLLLLTCCGGDTAVKQPAMATAREAVVTRGTFQTTILMTGELEAVEAALVVVPRTPLWRMPIRWMEEDGAVVKEGQKVIELDPRPDGEARRHTDHSGRDYRQRVHRTRRNYG